MMENNHFNVAWAKSTALMGSSGLDSVDKDHVAHGILIVGGAVGLGDRGVNSGVGGNALGEAIINLEGDGGGGLQVIGGIEGSVSDLGDLCEQGVDVDDAILVDLGQAALSTDLVDRVDGVQRIAVLGVFHCSLYFTVLRRARGEKTYEA